MIRSHVLICGGTGCTSSGSPALKTALEKAGIPAENTRVTLPGAEDILTPMLQVSDSSYGYGYVNVFDSAELAALPGEPVVFGATIEGEFPENSYPADENLSLKKGAKVMFIRNDTEGRFYNGIWNFMSGSSSSSFSTLFRN